MLKSVVCRNEHFSTSWLKRWAMRIEPLWTPEHPRQRKLWEWCAISQGFFERGKLQPGKRGLGFAVGTEPLSSLFASFGATIEATDLAVGEESSNWNASNQHASTIDAIYKTQLLTKDEFMSRVTFHPADMRDLTSFSGEKFDFIWSSCSLEHLGNLNLGLKFVEESSKLLNSGGVAIHTTEFNCTSNQSTIEEGGSVIYRQSDLVSLKVRLENLGFSLSEYDFFIGDDEEDRLFDYQPYGQHGRHHLKLLIGGYIATSIVIIIERS